MTDPRRALHRLAVVGLLGVVACGRGVAGPPPATHTVTIEAMQFTPATLTVKSGDTITWVNRDMFPHTATATERFDSTVIAPGESWSHRLTSPGEFPYLCTLHPPMRGTIRVE